MKYSIRSFADIYQQILESVNDFVNPYNLSFVGVPDVFYDPISPQDSKKVGLEGIFFMSKTRNHAGGNKDQRGNLHHPRSVHLRCDGKTIFVNLKKEKRDGETAKDCLMRLGASENEAVRKLRRHH